MSLISNNMCSARRVLRKNSWRNSSLPSSACNSRRSSLGPASSTYVGKEKKTVYTAVMVGPIPSLCCNNGAVNHFSPFLKLAHFYSICPINISLTIHRIGDAHILNSDCPNKFGCCQTRPRQPAVQKSSHL